MYLQHDVHSKSIYFFLLPEEIRCSPSAAAWRVFFGVRLQDRDFEQPRLRAVAQTRHFSLAWMHCAALNLRDAARRHRSWVGRLAYAAEERHCPIRLDDLRKAVAYLKAEGFADARTLGAQQAAHRGQSNLPEKVFLVIGRRFYYELVNNRQNWYAGL